MQNIIYGIECLFCKSEVEILQYNSKERRDKAFDHFVKSEKEWKAKGQEELIDVENPKKVLLRKEYESLVS